MGISLAAGALAFGWLTDRTKAIGISRETLLGCLAGVFIAAQLAIILRLPVPGVLSWSIIATVGAATVVSYAIVPSYFPSSMSGRANAALNFLHMSAAFVMQSATGAIIDLWPKVDGHPPEQAYQAAFGLNVGLQAAALLWFIGSAIRVQSVVYAVRSPLQQAITLVSPRSNPSVYDAALEIWVKRNQTACTQLAYWRRTAAASGLLMVAVASAVTVRAQTQSIAYMVTAGAVRSELFMPTANPLYCPSAGSIPCKRSELAKSATP